MRIGEVSKITGLSEHTLRYYEKEGLLPNVAKRRGGVRDYCNTDIEALGVIECLKQTGMPLADIRQFMQWCAMGDKTITQRRDMFINRKRAVMEKIAELKHALKLIDFKIKYYTDACDAGTLKIYDGKDLKKPDFFAMRTDKKS